MPVKVSPLVTFCYLPWPPPGELEREGLQALSFGAQKLPLFFGGGAMGEVSCGGREGESKGDICISLQICPGSLTSQAAPAELRALLRTLLSNLAARLRARLASRGPGWSPGKSLLRASIAPGMFPSIISFNSHDSPVKQGLLKVKRSPRGLPKFTQPGGGCLSPSQADCRVLTLTPVPGCLGGEGGV